MGRFHRPIPDILYREWDLESNIYSLDNTPANARKAHWICSACSHHWYAEISPRLGGVGCPACAGKVVTGSNNVGALYPHFKEEWDYSKNEKTPFDYTKGSRYRAHWICTTCDHRWNTINLH